MFEGDDYRETGLLGHKIKLNLITHYLNRKSKSMLFVEVSSKPEADEGRCLGMGRYNELCANPVQTEVFWFVHEPNRGAC